MALYAGFDPDTFMVRVPPSQWWRLNKQYQAFPDTYQTLYVVFLFKGWTFADWTADGPPANDRLETWGLWEGENPEPGKNWWTEYYDNGLWLPLADGTDWVNEFWQIGTGIEHTIGGTWDDWIDLWHSFPVLASNRAHFKLGMASRITGRMAQLRCAMTIENALGLDNRGRPLND